MEKEYSEEIISVIRWSSIQELEDIISNITDDNRNKIIHNYGK